MTRDRKKTQVYLKILTEKQQRVVRDILIEGKRRYNHEEPNEGYDYIYDELESNFGKLWHNFGFRFPKNFVNELIDKNKKYFDGKSRAYVPAGAEIIKTEK